MKWGEIKNVRILENMINDKNHKNITQFLKRKVHWEKWKKNDKVFWLFLRSLNTGDWQVLQG